MHFFKKAEEIIVHEVHCKRYIVDLSLDVKAVGKRQEGGVLQLFPGSAHHTGKDRHNHTQDLLQELLVYTV